jgi:hypothetical protein
MKYNCITPLKEWTGDSVIGLGAFAASELAKVFSGYQPR